MFNLFFPHFFQFIYFFITIIYLIINITSKKHFSITHLFYLLIHPPSSFSFYDYFLISHSLSLNDPLQLLSYYHNLFLMLFLLSLSYPPIELYNQFFSSRYPINKVITFRIFISSSIISLILITNETQSITLILYQPQMFFLFHSKYQTILTSQLNHVFVSLFFFIKLSNIPTLIYIKF